MQQLIVQQPIGEYKLYTLAYKVMDYIASSPDLMNELSFWDYHNFTRAEVPAEWIKDMLDVLHIKKDEVRVQIACAKGMHQLHYHIASHAVDVIMGDRCGVSNPTEGSYVIVGDNIIKPVQGQTVYFPHKVPHTFCDIQGVIWFVNIQNPPLEKPNGSDDYYWYEE